jgi:hypothetical protein
MTKSYGATEGFGKLLLHPKQVDTSPLLNIKMNGALLGPGKETLGGVHSWGGPWKGSGFTTLGCVRYGVRDGGDNNA